MANQNVSTHKNRKRIGAWLGRFTADYRALTAPQRKRLFVAAALICLMIAVSAVGGLLAKYVSQNRQEAEMISAGFHISSDHLKENTKNVDVATTGEIRVELYNWEVENTVLVAEMDIGYQVDVQGGSLTSVTLNDDPLDIVRPVNRVYTLARGSEENAFKTKHILHITPAAGAETVTVTVKNTSPYLKNGESGLSAVFTRKVSANPTYELTQQAAPDVWKLTIKTNGYVGPIMIKCNIAPDNTNDCMSEWTTGSTEELTVMDNETYELLFFGTAASIEETPILRPGIDGITIGEAESEGN